mmetsp:Transcript_39139/g.124263  ORF Transcript_39139/g.124263 Transcript_39139/m.124263 type:complete len:217 (+) Transcript_39139:171-821(+)
MASPVRITCCKPGHPQLFRSPSAPAGGLGSRAATPASGRSDDEELRASMGTALALGALWRRQGRAFLRETEWHPDDRYKSVPPTPQTPAGGSRACSMTMSSLDRRCDGLLEHLIQDGRGFSLAQRSQAKLYDQNRALAQHDAEVRAACEGTRRGQFAGSGVPSGMWNQTFHSGFSTTYGSFHPDAQHEDAHVLEGLRAKARFANTGKRQDFTKWGS